MARRRTRRTRRAAHCKCVRGKKVCWTASGKFKRGRRQRCGR